MLNFKKLQCCKNTKKKQRGTCRSQYKQQPTAQWKSLQETEKLLDIIRGVRTRREKREHNQTTRLHHTSETIQLPYQGNQKEGTGKATEWNSNEVKLMKFLR